MKIYVNNQIISTNIPSIYANDRGLLLGDGIFETIKVVQNHFRYFPQHYSRLKNSANVLAIPLQWNLNELHSICQEVIKVNALDRQTAGLRITLTRGQSERGIDIPQECYPSLIVSAIPYTCNANFYPKTMISQIKRNEYSELTRHKTIHYLESILARKTARENGFDEAILLNTKGAIAESSVANLFFVIEGNLLTPRIEDGVLPGIIRHIILERCRAAAIPIIETEIMPQQALQATEAFQTNSLIEIQSLSAINGKVLNYGSEAKFTAKIKQLIAHTDHIHSHPQ